MTDTTHDDVPVPLGWEAIAGASADLRAWRAANKLTLNDAASRVGAAAPQWREWEMCLRSGMSRPGGDYREKLELLTGIERHRWRTRDEQASIEALRAQLAATADAVVIRDPSGVTVVREGFDQSEGA
jgi:hypothetical protein